MINNCRSPMSMFVLKDMVQKRGNGKKMQRLFIAISRRLRRALAEADVPFDRKKFSPHITIIRRAKGSIGDIPSEELEHSFDASMKVDHISLMRSDRGKQSFGGCITPRVGKAYP